MGNNLLTPSIIAKEAIMVLINNLVFAGLVHRDFSNEYAKVGDTITVRKPPTFVSNEWNGSTITVQDAVEGSVPVKMDTILDVSFAAGSKEMALTINDFSEQFIQPAMRAHSQKLDELLAARYIDLPYFTTIGSSADISDIAAIDTIMNDNMVPLDQRRLVLNPTAKSKYGVLPEIIHLEKSGSTAALRDANLGRVLGFDTYMSQNIKKHTYGTATAANATGTAGESTIALSSVTATTATFKAGDVFTIAGNTQQFVVTENAAAVDGAVSALKIYPALPAGFSPSGAALTFQTKTAQNIAFHRNCFALVTRPLEKPMGAAYAETLSFNGVSCRIVAGYDMNAKKDTISIDFLCGVKTLTPELGVRFMG